MTMPCEDRNNDWPPALLAWFHRHQRVLPWRSEPTPYRVWISEIMLQQTQVATVLPYFERFLACFPTLRSLADADLHDVLKAWEGLGYYSRARNLHRAAQQVRTRHGGELPADPQALLELPGIGRYTAAAIASIAFGQPFPVVDGNVLRVFARFWGIADDVRSGTVRDRFYVRLAPIIERQSDPSAFNQAIMELGALVCTVRRPQCATCPLADNCVARADGRTGELPVKARRAAVPHVDVAVGLVWREGRVLIARRPLAAMLGGLWEFPGGKQVAGETLEETAVREIREETGLDVEVGERLCTVRHAYSHFRITLTAFHCRLQGGALRMDTARPCEWVRPEDLDRFAFPRANAKVIAALRL